MHRRVHVTVLAAAGLLLLLTAPAAAARRFAGVALGNSASGRLVAKHRFVVGDGYTLRLRDRVGARTRYRVCLTRGTVRRSCRRGRTGRRSTSGVSQDRMFVAAPERLGRYVYRWYVRGRQVAAWRVTIGIGD